MSTTLPQLEDALPSTSFEKASMSDGNYEKEVVTVDSSALTRAGGETILSSAELAKLVRKVDLRLMPIMVASNTLQYINKVMLNYANVMGLQKDTGLHGDQFTWLATAFFISFAIAQIPGIYFAARFPVNWYLGISLVCCGIVMAASAACNNYASLATVRVLLAIVESVIVPSLSLVTMKWYTRLESTKRFGIWYCGVGLGQMLGGLLSFGFQHVRHSSLANWRGMFLTLGFVDLLIAAWVIFYLTDNPTTASWLTPTERAYFAQRILSNNKSSVNTRRFRLSQVISTLTTDLAFWLISFTAALSSLPSGAITTFSATLIAGFGYSSEAAALLNIPSGAVAVIASLVSTWFAERNVPRSIATLALLAPSIVGGALMSFGPNKGSGLLGIWLINAAIPTFVITMNWGQANCAGHTKRATYNAMVMIAFGISNICGPQTFQARDAPGYEPAKITILVSLAMTGAMTIVLVGLYSLRNTRRRGEEVEDLQGAEEVDKVDFEVSGFRYVY